jgi:hypothetical protein
VICLREIGFKIKKKDWASLSFTMVISLRETGLITSYKVSAALIIKMVIILTVSIRKELEKDMEYTFLLQAINFKEIGKEITNVSANILIPKVTNMKEG